MFGRCFRNMLIAGLIMIAIELPVVIPCATMLKDNILAAVLCGLFAGLLAVAYMVFCGFELVFFLAGEQVKQ